MTRIFKYLCPSFFGALIVFALNSSSAYAEGHTLEEAAADSIAEKAGDALESASDMASDMTDSSAVSADEPYDITSKAFQDQMEDIRANSTYSPRVLCKISRLESEYPDNTI